MKNAVLVIGLKVYITVYKRLKNIMNTGLENLQKDYEIFCIKTRFGKNFHRRFTAEIFLYSIWLCLLNFVNSVHFFLRHKY